MNCDEASKLLEPYADGELDVIRCTELERPLPVQSSQLADQGNMVSVPAFAHRMGNLGHLLFQSAVCWIACRVGGVLCDTRDMAALTVARSTRIPRLHRVVSRRGRLVAVHFSLS